MRRAPNSTARAATVSTSRSRSSMLSRITRSSACASLVRQLAGARRDDRLDRFAGALGGVRGGFLDLDQRSDQRRRRFRR